MAQLLVRGLPEAVVAALRRRAAKHGRSAEAEHREILREALIRRRGPSLKDHLLAMPDAGEDADFAVARDVARRVDL